jgi:bidirectional [NiFe] hydrogenase diaphorase subunit
MVQQRVRPEHPSDDTRWKMVAATMRRHGYSRHSLIETLHTVQDCFGCLDETAMRFIARSLRVPLSSVYGVATFYHFFQLTPPGRHTCVVCTGTACYIKNAASLIELIHGEHGVQPGETTPDGELSLLTARCIGACSAAPAVVWDGQVHGGLDPSLLRARLAEWIHHES